MLNIILRLFVIALVIGDAQSVLKKAEKPLMPKQDE